MGAIFTVEADPVTNIVRHYLAGFFEVADVERYIAARNAAHEKLSCGPHEHVTLVDVRDIKIQPQAIVQAFANMLADPRYRSRKLAFACSPSLARMQLLRASEGRSARFFSDIDAAEAWLWETDSCGTAANPPARPQVATAGSALNVAPLAEILAQPKAWPGNDAPKVFSDQSGSP